MKKTRIVETMTPKQYAAKHQVAYTTVMKWLQADLVPGAYKQDLPLPFKGYVYQIPADAPPPEMKPGPKPKPKPEEPVAAKKTPARQKGAKTNA